MQALKNACHSVKLHAQLGVNFGATVSQCCQLLMINEQSKKLEVGILKLKYDLGSLIVKF